MVKRINESMSFDDVYDLISSLARSQGFYGRLKRDIDSLDEEDYCEFAQMIEDQDFQDDIDVILFFES